MTPAIVAFLIFLTVLSVAYALLSSNTPTDPTPDTVVGTTLFDKWVRPKVTSLVPYLPESVTKSGGNRAVRELLARSGNPWKVTPEEYIVIRVVSVLVGVLVMTGLFMTGLLPIPVYAAIALGGILGFVGPKTWLDVAWAKRRRDLLYGLPNVLDLLRDTMSAGNSFINSLAETLERFPESVTKSELGRVVTEIQVGMTESAALTALAIRCPTPGVKSFTRAVIQAQNTGSDISQTLAAQAKESRLIVVRAVKEKAQKLQTQLFLPVIGFFLPVLLLILMGPQLAGLMGGLTLSP